VLIACVLFSLQTTRAQSPQQQAKIQYYEAMIGDDNIVLSERESYYDSLIIIYQNIHELDKVRDYYLEKMKLYYTEGEYMEVYKTGLQMMDTFDNSVALTNDELSQKSRAHLSMGKSCINLGMFDEGASNLYAVIQSPDNPYTIEAYSYLGFIFMQMQQMEQSKNYNDIALELLSETDSLSRKKASSIVYNNLAGYYYSLKPPALDSALYYLNRSIDFFDYAENFASKSYIYHNMAIIYQEMGEIGMAENYLRKAIEVSDKEPYNMARYLQNLAYLLYTSNRINEAEKYYYQALEAAEEADVIRVKSSVLIELSDLFYKKQQYKKSADYFKEGVALRDSIFNNQSMERISLLSQQFDNYKITTEKELLEKELQVTQLSDQKKSIIVGILLALLFIISIITFAQIKKIGRNSQKNLQRETRIAEENIREEYKSSLDEKDRKLASNALFLMKTNEILISLEQSIKQLSVWKDPAKRNEIIKEMESVINSYNAGQGWEEFKLYFEQIHPTFYANLNQINPNLSKMQQRLCALLVLNMNTKEIAEVTNRSVRTIETLLYRLRKSLDIPADEKTVTFLRRLL